MDHIQPNDTGTNKNPPENFYPVDITVNDVRIHGRMYGSDNRPVLVMLHGNGEDLHIFDSQISFFSKDYRVIALDSRGHGKSTRGTAPLNFDTMAKDLLAVFDFLQIPQAYIFGFSDGAITALHFTLMAPGRVSSLILFGANYHPKGIIFRERIQIRLFYLWLSFLALFSAGVRKKKEIWGLMIFHPNLMPEELSRIKVPTLVVTGEKDMVSQRHNDELSNAIEGSERVIIPGEDHFAITRMPDTVNRIVVDFLNKLKIHNNL